MFVKIEDNKIDDEIFAKKYGKAILEVLDYKQYTKSIMEIEKIISEDYDLNYVDWNGLGKKIVLNIREK